MSKTTKPAAKSAKKTARAPIVETKINKSAKTGEIVTKEYAEHHPATTYAMSIKRPLAGAALDAKRSAKDTSAPKASSTAKTSAKQATAKKSAPAAKKTASAKSTAPKASAPKATASKTIAPVVQGKTPVEKAKENLKQKQQVAKKADEKYRAAVKDEQDYNRARKIAKTSAAKKTQPKSNKAPTRETAVVERAPQKSNLFDRFRQGAIVSSGDDVERAKTASSSTPVAFHTDVDQAIDQGVTPPALPVTPPKEPGIHTSAKKMWESTDASRAIQRREAELRKVNSFVPPVPLMNVSGAIREAHRIEHNTGLTELKGPTTSKPQSAPAVKAPAGELFNTDAVSRFLAERRDPDVGYVKPLPSIL